jgi:hypothetical protein
LAFHSFGVKVRKIAADNVVINMINEFLIRRINIHLA